MLFKLVAYIFILQNYFIKAEFGLNLQKCSLSSSDLNDCLLDNINNNMRLFLNGIPELGIKSLKRFTSDDFAFNDIPGVNVHLKNMTILVNDDKILLKKLRINLNKNKLFLAFNVEGRIETGAEISGSLFANPITTKSKFLVDFNDTVIVCRIKFHNITHPDGKDYFKLSQYQITIYIGPVNIHYDVLSNDEEHLRPFYDLSISEIKSNMEFFIRNWGRIMITSISKKLIDYFINIASTIPIDFLFIP